MCGICVDTVIANQGYHVCVCVGGGGWGGGGGKLYLSGAFIFGLAYCGSNLNELAQLFKVAHLVQGFR
jgi:hypothetical protein